MLYEVEVGCKLDGKRKIGHDLAHALDQRREALKHSEDEKGDRRT